MMEIIAYFSSHWVEWLFAILIGALGYGYRTVTAQLKAERDKNTAIAEGMQALLRDSIVESYNKYTDKGYCPIFAKESCKRLYKAYTKLGGNDVATELYHKLLRMEEEKNEQ